MKYQRLVYIKPFSSFQGLVHIRTFSKWRACILVVFVADIFLSNQSLQSKPS